MTISKKKQTMIDSYLTFSGGYRLANYKKSSTSGLEYPGFEADIAFEGEIIGNVRDLGDGGPTDYSITDPAREAELLMHSFRANSERGQKYCRGRHIELFLGELEEVEASFKRAHASKKKTFFIKPNSLLNTFGLPEVLYAVNSGYCADAVSAIEKTAAGSFVFAPEVLARWPMLKISKSRK